MHGYSQINVDPDEERLLRDQLDELPLELQAHGPPHRRSLLLLAPGETPWRTGPMVLMSARLLRRLLGETAHRFTTRRAGKANRVDLRV